MFGGRTIVLIAAATTLASIAVAGAGYDERVPLRRRDYDFPVFRCEPSRAKITDERMTKREHRDMMQRDFARGGNRPGRRRKNRMQGTRWKS